MFRAKPFPGSPTCVFFCRNKKCFSVLGTAVKAARFGSQRLQGYIPTGQFWDACCIKAIQGNITAFIKFRLDFLMVSGRHPKKHILLKVTAVTEVMTFQSTPRGFEPRRAEPNGFQIHHLSHSVTVSRFLLRNIHYT